MYCLLKYASTDLHTLWSNETESCATKLKILRTCFQHNINIKEDWHSKATGIWNALQRKETANTKEHKRLKVTENPMQVIIAWKMDLFGYKWEAGKKQGGKNIDTKIESVMLWIM